MQKKPSQFVIRVALYCLPALAALRPKLVTDPDIWWHTRIGEWIVQHRTVPVTDPFSTFGAGKTWFAYSWSFDLLFYWLQHRFGLLGYVAYVAVMTLAIAVVLTHLIERFEPRFAWSSALVAVGLFALGRMYTPRSWLVTILFFLLLLEILVSYREGRRKALLLLPPLFFIWANPFSCAAQSPDHFRSVLLSEGPMTVVTVSTRAGKRIVKETTGGHRVDAIFHQLHLAMMWLCVPTNVLCAAACCTFSCYLRRSLRPLVGCMVLLAIYTTLLMSTWRPEGPSVPTAPASHESQNFLV